MAETFEGYVHKLESYSPDNADWTSWSSRLVLKDGSVHARYIQYGFDKPSVSEGDYIQIQVEFPNDKAARLVEGSSVRRNPNADPMPEVQQSNSRGKGRGKGGGGGRGYNDPEREKRIVWQHSQEMAITALANALENDAVVFTTAKAKANQAKRYEEFFAMLDKLTVKFFNDAMTPSRVLDNVADEGLINTEARGELPPDSEGDGFEETGNAADTSDDGFEDTGDGFEDV